MVDWRGLSIEKFNLDKPMKTMKCFGAALVAQGCLLIAPPMLWAASGPGEVFFKQQAALIKQFDRDGNGRLDAKERETMRLHGREKGSKKGGGDVNGIPAEFIKKHDANKNGEMDDEEWGPAIAKEVAVVVKRFDADESGDLNEAERKEVRAAMKKGEFEGIYEYFAGQAARDPKEEARRRRRGPAYLQKYRSLLAFDLNDDGLASNEDLRAIRESRRREKAKEQD